VREVFTKARGSSSCSRSSLSRLRALPPSLRPSFSSISATFCASSSLTTEPGRILFSLPTASQIALPTRCDSASSPRPKGEMKPMEFISSGPTGLSAASGRSSSSWEKSWEAGKRKNVRLRKNMRLLGA